MIELLKLVGEGMQIAVRPVIAIMMAWGVLWGFTHDKLDAAAFSGMAGLALGFYFQRRENGKVAPPPAP